MTIDNDFNLAEMTQSQNDKYITHNTENRRIAAAVAGRTSVDMGSDANLTLNASDTDGTESWRYRFINITDTGVALTATRDVVMPAKGTDWIVENETAQSLVFKITGQTGVTVTTGNAAHIYYQATAGDIVALKNPI